jgi:hypothetical protein
MRNLPHVLAILGILLLANCDETDNLDALDKLAIIFEGSYARSQIKIRMDKTMNSYDIPITDDNYMKIANVLVAMRKQNHVKEMDLLTCALTARREGVPVGSDGYKTFGAMAALCAVSMRRQ